MKVNTTIMVEMLGHSQMCHLVEHREVYSSWYETYGPMDFTIYILGIFQVILNMFVISVLLFFPKNKNPQFNSFYFIINLAATDIVGFVMNLNTVFIQQHVWSHQKDYSSFDPETYAILSGSLSYITTNLDEVKCIVTHTSSKWPDFVTGSLILLTIVVDSPDLLGVEKENIFDT